MTQRVSSPRPAPWIIALLGLALALAAGTLRVVNGRDPNGINHYTPVGLTTGFILPVLGAMIIRRHPGHRVGWFLALCGVSASTVALSNEWLVRGQGALPGSGWAAWASSWLWLVSFFLLPTVLIVIFPSGTAPSKRWQPVLWMLVAVWASDSIWMMAAPFDEWPEGWTDLANPFPWVHGPDRLEDVVSWWPIVLVGSFVLAVGALVRRLGSSTGIERRQLMPFALAAFIEIGWLLTDLSTGLSEKMLWLDALGSILMPAGAAIGIFAFALLDVDRVVSRSFTLLLATLAASAVYGFTLLVANAFFVADDPAVSVLGVGLVAAAALPILHGARTAAGRLLFGERQDPVIVMRRLGERLEALVEPAVAAAVVAETIGNALRVPGVRVHLRAGEPVVWGRPRGEPARFEIGRGGRSLGELEVSERSDVDPLGAAERRLVVDLLNTLADVLSSIELSQEVLRSREALVRAREEERRRIRNDLHDGLGPQLAAIGLQLDIARARLDDRTHPASAPLGNAKAALIDAIGDIRRLVEGLRPPALDEMGLLGAIRHQVDGLSDSTSGVEVTLRCEGVLPPLPAAVEVAAFRIISEAVNNALRHGRARVCAVVLDCSTDLEIEVTDDGVGFSHKTPTGVGLTSMRQRTEELGGCFAIESTSRGTIVRAQLPVSPMEALT